ncbi:MAG: radical SAM protein [Candidatus Omnitrophota bacterium]
MPNSKVLLCIPPDYDRYFPPLGTAALCGFLKARGIAVTQVDLNLGYRDFLAGRIQGVPGGLTEKRLLLKHILKKFFSENLKGRYYSSLLLRGGSASFADLPYDNNTNSSFHFTERLLSSLHLWLYLEDGGENTFLQFYQDEGILSFLNKEEIGLLGISIISPSQAIAGLTLGLFVKKNLPNIHVNIGGQWPTLFRRSLQENKGLFKCFDSMTVFEGETPLFCLSEALTAKRDISKIPNVITKNSGPEAIIDHRGEDMDLLPAPDFGGLPLGLYDESRDESISLTFETSRGCYWSKCAYCVDLPLPKPAYRRKDARLVVRDIKMLQEKYQAKMLLLGDPGMSPRQMLEVSRELLNSKVDIAWWVMARLDPGFTPEIFRFAHRAGLKKINFGFESGSDAICDLLGKGNRRERSGRVIKDCAQAGIEVDLQTILGLPRETFEHSLETIDFLIRNKEYITAVTFNIFYLTPENYVYRDPQKYGIAYNKNDELPFRFFIPFDNPQGMSRDEAHLAQHIYYSLRGKVQNKGPAAVLAQSTPAPGPFVSQEAAQINLCGESTSLRYFYDKENDTYLFPDD